MVVGAFIPVRICLGSMAVAAVYAGSIPVISDALTLWGQSPIF